MEKYELTDLHYFEVMDRAYCALEWFDDIIYSHPCVSENQELQKAADDVEDAMYKFYNLAAHYYDAKENRAKHYLMSEKGDYNEED